MLVMLANGEPRPDTKSSSPSAVLVAGIDVCANADVDSDEGSSAMTDYLIIHTASSYNYSIADA